MTNMKRMLTTAIAGILTAAANTQTISGTRPSSPPAAAHPQHLRAGREPASRFTSARSTERPRVQGGRGAVPRDAR